MGRSSPVATVALLSAATLAYEILLVRAFAIEYFHHFAYFAVGVAMLGYGVSGTVVALRPGLTPERLSAPLRWSASLAPLAFLASPALADRIPLDPTQLAWDGRQWPLIGLMELALALPFSAAALGILLALAGESRNPGRLYAASFAGAGAGAAVAIGSLWLVSPRHALAIPALIAGIAALDPALQLQRAPRAALIGRLVPLVAVLAAIQPPWSLDVTPYKGLPQVEAYPEARRVAEDLSPVGWVVEVEAPAFRHAPGLSLAYRGGFPRQNALFVDGHLVGATNVRERADGSRDFLDHLPASLPYALGHPGNVLVIGAGEGTEVRSALAHGARRITAVELHPALARRIGGPPQWERTGEVRWIVADARAHIAGTPERYDLITLGVGGAFGTTAAGLHALDEDFLHTIDAYELFLRRLTGGGTLCLTRWLAGPPREPVRAILTACGALRRIAPNAAPRALVVMRSWATVTILVKPSGFTSEEIAKLRSWTEARGFDLDWTPGLGAEPAAGFNAVQDAVLYRAARAGVAGTASADAFASEYPFRVEPLPDSRPYTHHFLRPSGIVAVLRSGGALLPFAEWGYLAVLGTLLLSTLLGGILLAAPLALGPRAPERGGRRTLLVYFAAIGFAYMAAEIAVIQQLGLLLGHPVYAVAASLAALLTFSGLGSACSERWGLGRAARGLGWLVALLVALALFLLLAVGRLQGAPLAVRTAGAIFALAPPAFLMGLPFPLGLAALARGDPARTAWAWAANGFASVVAAPLAALIAIEWGSRALFLAAAAGYGLALAAIRRAPQETPPRLRAGLLL